MERLYLEYPTLKRKEQAIDYINETIKYNSEIHGTGSLHNYLDNYERWLLKIEEDKNRKPTEAVVPALTYFLIREYDDKIIGMINIRLCLNKRLAYSGGNIGYSIRPTERRKGYAKINLYLALKVCQEHGLEEVFLDCVKENIASSSTMKAVGGVLVKDYLDETDGLQSQKYSIDVAKTLKEYENLYDQKEYIK